MCTFAKSDLKSRLMVCIYIFAQLITKMIRGRHKETLQELRAILGGYEITLNIEED